jgi:hypothetical protein
MNAGVQLLLQHAVMEYTGTKYFLRVWLFTKFCNISTNITEKKHLLVDKEQDIRREVIHCCFKRIN